MKTILVVEETRDIITSSIEDICAGLDVRVEHSPDALHGIMRALDATPDLIVIDADSAWLGTQPMTEAIQRERRLRSIPVIAVATDDGDEKLAPARHRLNSALLRWPADAAALRRRLRSTVGTTELAFAGSAGHANPVPP